MYFKDLLFNIENCFNSYKLKHINISVLFERLFIFTNVIDYYYFVGYIEKKQKNILNDLVSEVCDYVKKERKN